MANRHLSRSIVLQTLFEWDFLGKIHDNIDIQDALNRNSKDFAPGFKDDAFIFSLIKQVLKKLRMN